MADLSSLIRLHKYDLDEKRRILGMLYDEHRAFLRQKQILQERLDFESQQITDGNADIHYTFADFAEKTRQQQQALDQEIYKVDVKILEAKDALMEVFGELKKYEMTQAERDRLEEEERKVKENKELDEIALEMFRRQND